MTELLNAAQTAQRLGLSTRQINNLVKRGCPKVSNGSRVLYDWPAVRDWYLEFKVQAEVDRVAPTDADAVKTRLTAAQARKAEIEVAALEERLLDATAVREAVEEMGDRLRAGLINLPASHGPVLERAGMEPGVALEVLRVIAEDLTARLRDAAAEGGDDD